MTLTIITCIYALLPLCARAVAWHRTPSPWTWTCENERCVKHDKTEVDITQTLETCSLVCGKFGSLWPRPTGKVELGNRVIPILPANIVISKATGPSDDVIEMLLEATELFNKSIKFLHPNFKKFGEEAFNRDYDDVVYRSKVKIELVVVSTETKVTSTTDENYTLGLQRVEDDISVIILANTFFGARHGLETLSQLMSFDPLHESLQIIEQASITDKPYYPYRGILVDSSRNFLSKETIKRIIDGMSYNKLNSLHWHITDTQSFPFYSKRVPQMTLYGAYSPRHIYYESDIRELVHYARIRGVRIIPEFDAPAHAGNGWQWGEQYGKGKLALCVNREPWSKFCVEPPCGQLNPLNDKMYDIVGEIYKDMMDLFDSDLFHMGGDEVNVNCWNSSAEIVDWMEGHGMQRNASDFINLWGKFQNKVYDKLTEANNGKEMTAILWTSHLTEKDTITKFLDKNKYIIQIWTTGTDPAIEELLTEGYRVIFSNYDALYLDCGFAAWIGSGSNWCSPYIGWQKVYDNSPEEIIESFNITQPRVDSVIRGSRTMPLILGGEAAMWSEQTDDNSIDMKIWPRAAALAERFWSNPSTKWEVAESRMLKHRERLVTRGIRADSLQPMWCSQNQGMCYL